MNEFKVLLTASGIGSRLGHLTEYSSKALVRIGNKPAISYIVEAYPEDTKFVVTIGHFGDHVKQFLTLSYPNKNFQFVEINPYDGYGSSLAYSILQAKPYINCPFIFHACDTIVLNKIPLPSNWLGGSKQIRNNSQYVSFDTVLPDVESSVIKIKDKGDFGGDCSYIGLAGIYDFELFFEILNEEYNNDKFNNQLSDVTAIKKMINIGFNSKFFDWYDIGNVDSLNYARNNFPNNINVLDKDEENIFLVDDYIIKFFSDSAICINRVKRANILGNLVPKIEYYAENFYKYQFVNGEVLSHCVNESIFSNFLNWAKDNLWIHLNEPSSKFSDVCYEFYFEKTQIRVAKFLKNSGIKDTKCQINGLEVPSVTKLLNLIDRDWLCNSDSYQFHGDCILENIIYTGDSFKLIDWRQDFGGLIEEGDIYYDLAKLNHNLIFNHEIVSKNLFTIEIKEDINCDILRSNKLTNCQSILFDFINENGYDLNKVRLLSAIIWLNMAGLHDGILGIFLYYFGKYNLFKSICNIRKSSLDQCP